MSIKIYKDDSANSIFIEDTNGSQFINSLQASVPVNKVNITDLARQIDIVTNASHTDFVDKDNNPYTGTAIDVCNTLNAIFQSSGTPTNELPSITSTLSINSVQGSIINYELTADYGVGYEWDLSTVVSLTTVEGNVRKLVGGASLPTGTYNIPVKAINYNGEDSKTLVLNVSTPAFPNTKSVEFDNNDYLQANAGILQNVLGRTANGSGSSDAWSVSFWFKGGTATNVNQTILYFGNQTVTNQGYIQILFNGSVTGQNLVLKYGSNSNNLTLSTPQNSLQSNVWTHALITYDGGTTGVASGSINNYYSRFKIFIDGSLSSTTNTNSNFGYSGSIIPQNFRIGRFNNGQSLRNNSRVDEISIWDSDVSSEISSIYNSGTPNNLSLLTSVPLHWWRMGDGDTFPFLFDTGSQANCTFQMLNMTSANIVNDVP